MANIESKTVSRTFRIPTFLANEIEALLDKIPKATNMSAGYIYLLDLGKKTFDQYVTVSDDPEKAQEIADELKALLKQNDLFHAVKNLPEPQQKALEVAMDMVIASKINGGKNGV